MDYEFLTGFFVGVGVMFLYKLILFEFYETFGRKTDTQKSKLKGGEN